MDPDQIIAEIYSLKKEAKEQKDILYGLCSMLVDRYCIDCCDECPIDNLCDVIEYLEEEELHSFAG